MSKKDLIIAFDGADITTDQTYTHEINNNFRFFIDWRWENVNGIAKFKVQASSTGEDGTWIDRPIHNPVTNTTVTEILIQGSDDICGIQIHDWIPFYIRLVLLSNTATSGTFYSNIIIHKVREY